MMESSGDWVWDSISSGHSHDPLMASGPYISCFDNVSRPPVTAPKACAAQHQQGRGTPRTDLQVDRDEIVAALSDGNVKTWGAAEGGSHPRGSYGPERKQERKVASGGKPLSAGEW